MARYRKLPVVIEATQWFVSGDHPEDNRECFHDADGDPFLGEGKVVRYYRTPELDGQNSCANCGKIMHNHGWIDTVQGGHIVCPGDWIITGVESERYPCKPSVFAATYEEVTEAVMGGVDTP